MSQPPNGGETATAGLKGPERLALSGDPLEDGAREQQRHLQSHDPVRPAILLRVAQVNRSYMSQYGKPRTRRGFQWRGSRCLRIFPGRIVRQLVDESHLSWNLVTGEILVAVRRCRARPARPRLGNNKRASDLAPHLVRYRDHCGLENAVELLDHVLNLDRVDVLASGNEHVPPAISGARTSSLSSLRESPVRSHTWCSSSTDAGGALTPHPALRLPSAPRRR